MGGIWSIVPVKWGEGRPQLLRGRQGQMLFSTVPVLSWVSVTCPRRSEATYSLSLFSKFYGAGGAADEHGQHACAWDQRPAVADAFFVEDSPEFGA